LYVAIITYKKGANFFKNAAFYTLIVTIAPFDVSTEGTIAGIAKPTELYFGFLQQINKKREMKFLNAMEERS
jgi:hypothetical protein